MSMWMSFARLTPEAFAKVKADPELLDAIFFEEDEAKCAELGLDDTSTCGVDYQVAADALVAMAEATGEEIDEDDPVLDDLDVSGELDFDAGYGPGFYLDPAAVKRAAEESFVPDMDEEAEAVFKKAAKAGEYLVGIIS